MDCQILLEKIENHYQRSDSLAYAGRNGSSKQSTSYEIIRKAHPDVPFLFIEDPIFPHLRFDKEAAARVKAKNEIWKKRYEQLAAKDPNLHYLAADHILGLDNEATVDGLHFTDLGFMRYSDLLEPIIRRIAKPAK